MAASFSLGFQSKVLPVIVLEDAALAVPLAHALLAGGVDAMEITLRHACALEAITQVAQAVPEMVVGAGTLTRVEDFQRVVDAGARFGVSPGLTPSLADAGRLMQTRHGVSLIPGVMTPSEVIFAREEGFHFLKLFPAVQAGGLGMLKSLASPFSDIAFCPTGGISPENMLTFLEQPNVRLVGGTWLTPNDLLKARDWPEITARAQHATEMVANLSH